MRFAGVTMGVLLAATAARADVAPGDGKHEVVTQHVFVGTDAVPDAKFVLYPKSYGSPIAALVAEGQPYTLGAPRSNEPPPRLFAVKGDLPDLAGDDVKGWLDAHALAKSSVELRGGTDRDLRGGTYLVHKVYRVKKVAAGAIDLALVRTTNFAGDFRSDAGGLAGLGGGTPTKFVVTSSTGPEAAAAPSGSAFAPPPRTPPAPPLTPPPPSASATPSPTPPPTASASAPAPSESATPPKKSGCTLGVAPSGLDGGLVVVFALVAAAAIRRRRFRSLAACASPT